MYSKKQVWGFGKYCTKMKIKIKRKRKKKSNVKQKKNMVIEKKKFDKKKLYVEIQMIEKE